MHMNHVVTLQATGLFDGVATPPATVIDSNTARSLARSAAAEGIVLLQNNGILPLKGTVHPSIGSFTRTTAAGTSESGKDTARLAPIKKWLVLGENGGCVAEEEAKSAPYPWCRVCGSFFHKTKELDDALGLHACTLKAQHACDPTEGLLGVHFLTVAIMNNYVVTEGQTCILRQLFYRVGQLRVR
jgi:beta-glucosidase-like glycosyl hydrolase